MTQMTTADFLSSVGNQPSVNMPPPLVNPWPYPDATETVKVRLRALLASDALSGIGSTFTSPAVGSKPAEAAMTKIYPQHKVATIVGDNSAMTVIATLAIGGTITTMTTAVMTDEWVSSVTSTVFLADASAGDDMQSTAPVVDLEPGTPVRVTAAPIGVTLARPTGVVIGPSEWEGYYVIRLDAPALYHHPDGTDESFDELVEAFDNFAVLTSKH